MKSVFALIVFFVLVVAVVPSYAQNQAQRWVVRGWGSHPQGVVGLRFSSSESQNATSFINLQTEDSSFPCEVVEALQVASGSVKGVKLLPGQQSQVLASHCGTSVGGTTQL